MRRFVCALFTFALIASSAAYAASSVPSSLSWRFIGPFRGGRAITVTGVPNEPNHFYFGAVNGGVWESTNAGRTWNPIFDSQPIGSIGAIAIAPSNTKTIYVGSGEADMRSSIANGNGMYKSTDGGKTWSHIGLDDSAQIGKIVVDPRDANIVYVAVLGHSYAPNAMRGVFKSTDGGATWNKVLFKNDDTGAIDLALDPSNAETIYASLWQTRRPPWNVYPAACGPGSGLYKSTDAGKTWTQLTNGIPASVCKIGLSISPANPKRVYAEIDTPKDIPNGGIYRSDDAGATWTHTAGGKEQMRLWQRGWYFSGITADPKNADVLYVMNTATYRSDDGGKTFIALKGSPGGDDYHVMWINPNDPSILELGGDQGVVISLDRGATWSSWLNQPTAQFYRVATDNQFLYGVYGAQQDSGAMSVASQSIHQNITGLNWRPMDVGGESGSIAADPNHPGRLIGGYPMTNEDLASGQELTIDPTTAYPNTDWRATWTLPLEVSPADHAIYASHQNVFRSRDGGQSWKIISPDLTRAEDITHPKNLDPSTVADNNDFARRGVVYALAPSPLDANLLWAGTDDGKMWVTRDGGAHWKDVTPKAVTAWSKVAMISASRFDKNTAYIAVDRHRLDDYTPYIYATHDGGASWSPIASGIPVGSSVNVVRADTKTRGLLFAGTERGIYISFDDGARWQSMQRNLPITSVRDIDVHGDDVVIATHGRGFWIMDNITPLRQHASASEGTDHLFAPGITYRTRRAGGVGGGVADEGTPIQPDEPQAPNPPVGMMIDYTVASSAPVAIDIINARGKVVRHYSSADKITPIDPATQDIAPRWFPAPVIVPTDTGTHRFVWDFTTREDGGPLAPPGTYTVRVTIGGKSYSQSATLRRDPRSLGNDADLQAQYDLANAIEDRLAQIKPAMAKAKGNKELRKLSDAFSFLEQAVESADAAPTHDQRSAYATLNAMLEKTLAKVKH